jgi:hypothetical protein
VLCQGPLRRHSVTCSRAPLAHNRYFCLSRATFKQLRRVSHVRGRARFASVLQNASQLQRIKTARIGALIALSCRNKATRCHIDAFAVDRANYRIKQSALQAQQGTALQPHAAERSAEKWQPCPASWPRPSCKSPTTAN